MAPERRPPDDPRMWLNRAKSNLARARADIRLSGVYLEDLCFDAQQAVEKALKTVLVFHGIDFPKTHDIAELLTLLNQSGQRVPEEFWKADELTHYAVETRYPSEEEPVTEEEYREAVALAEKVVRWADESLSTSRE